MTSSTPQTAPVEVRARERLAAELRLDGKVCAASRILHPIDAGTAMENAAIRAIEKALSQPAPISGDVEALNAYRAAASFIGADAWDGCGDCMDILRAARALDVTWDWAGDPNRIAEELKKVRSRAALKAKP